MWGAVLTCAAPTQDRTDEMADDIVPGDYLCFDGPEDSAHAPDGYYIARATSAVYILAEDTDLPELKDAEGKPVRALKGSHVFDATWLNRVPPTIHGTKGWYTNE